MNLAGPHAADALRQQRVPGRRDLLEREILQDRQLRPQPLQQAVVLRLYALGVGACAHHLGERLRQGDETRIGSGGIRTRARRAVGEFLHPVVDADRHRLAARRATPAVRDRGCRFPADPALAMPIQVVLAFLRKELDGAAIPAGVTACERPEQRIVAQLRVEHGCLPRQLRRRVGVGAGDERVAVQPGDAPVHRRIGREAGLYREDLRRQIGETLLDRIEPGPGAQDGEPRRPDVSGNQVAALIGFQDDLQQIPAVKTQDRASVGADVADLLELSLQVRSGLERGGEDDVVHLAGPVELLVDVADLAADQEPDGPATGCGHLVRHRGLELRPQPEQPVFGRIELFLHLGEPAGMGDVAGGDHLHPLELRPLPEVLQRQLPAGGARVMGVEVQVGDQLHAAILMRAVWPRRHGRARVPLPFTSRGGLEPPQQEPES